MTVTSEDLRAAVAAGIVDEAQAANMLTLAQSRAGQRAGMAEEDEPFEFFKGFAEIFVSVGLILLIAGAMTLVTLMGGGLMVPAVLAGACWAMAGYFTRRRRMSLPSIVLTCGFATGVTAFVGFLLFDALELLSGDNTQIVAVGLIGVVAMAAWYRAFRVPFAMFVLGLFGLWVVFGLFGGLDEVGGNRNYNAFLDRIFDLRAGSALALGTLVFGLAAFVGAMWFDLGDPHRLGRHAASGFWLHLLAAPALVNTVAMTALNVGGTAGYLLTAGALVAIAAFALVIDRRSFLTAGIVYLGIVIGWAISAGQGEFSFAWLLLILGGLVTALGTWWVDLRAGLLRALPDFPGKSRLPPFARPE